MRLNPILLVIPAFVALSACNEQESLETYTCPNGPDVAVAYSEEGALLRFVGGRTELLPPTDKPDIYAKPGIVWNSSAFRSARLDDGQESYLCDQMAG